MTVHNLEQAHAADYHDDDAAAYCDTDGGNSAAAYHDTDAGNDAAYWGDDTGAGDDVGYRGGDADGSNDGDAGEIRLPADAERMIGRWRELGRPFIELEPGVVISNLERWLYNNPPAPGVWLARVREYLYIDTRSVDAMAA